MPRLTTHQEVVLVQGTKFANRQYAENNSKPNTNNYLSQHEKLKDACWNGQLKEMMPELFYMFTSDTNLFLWQMREGEKVITMELSEEPTELDFHASIDPYIFMEIQEYN